MKTSHYYSRKSVQQALKMSIKGLFAFASIAAFFNLSAELVIAAEKVVTVDNGWKIVIAPREIATEQPNLLPETSDSTASTNLTVESEQLPTIQEIAFKPTEEEPAKKKKEKKTKKKNKSKKNKKGETEPQKTKNDLPLIVPRTVHSPTYYEVFDSIPFSRSEYMANPSYRSEATMEIMFGKLRPTTIVKGAPQARYGGPQYRLSYPYARRPRVNYNFYYRRPTVYRHY